MVNTDGKVMKTLEHLIPHCVLQIPDNASRFRDLAAYAGQGKLVPVPGACNEAWAQMVSSSDRFNECA